MRTRKPGQDRELEDLNSARQERESARQRFADSAEACSGSGAACIRARPWPI